MEYCHILITDINEVRKLLVPYTDEWNVTPLKFGREMKKIFENTQVLNMKKGLFWCIDHNINEPSLVTKAVECDIHGNAVTENVIFSS